MRFTPIALSAAIAFATMASSGHSQRPDDQIDARSVALTRQAQALAAAGKLSEAQDVLETALAVDPRNRGAYMALAKVVETEGLPGKAVLLYSKALALEPNDVNALAGQGEALVQRGAVERAKLNLEKVHALCKSACPQAQMLAAAIAKGPPPQIVTAQAPKPADNEN